MNVTLQLLALRALIENLPARMPQILSVHRDKRYGYIGDPDMARDLLSVVVSIENSIVDKYHADFIMDLFTFMFIHSTDLVFPSSRYIPTLRHLETHLLHHGYRLTELSLANCYSDENEELLKVISCSPLKVLKCLTLPRNRVSERGADVIKKSEFINTLQTLKFSSTVFSTMDVLLEILSSLTNLKVLSLSNISCGGGGGTSQILPIPLGGVSSNLEHLRIYNYTPPEFVVDPEQLSNEWVEFCQQYPNLRILRLLRIEYIIGNYYTSLCALRDGLDKRKEPLTYLSLETTDDKYSRLIVRQMNATRITTCDTLRDILYQIKKEGLGDDITQHLLWKIGYIWRKLEDKRNNHNICRHMLAIIDRVIHKYKHFPQRMFSVCVEALLFMVQDSKLREELKLTPLYIEKFITNIMGPQNEEDCFLVSIFEILIVYGDSISVDVFEMVLKKFAFQNRYGVYHRSQIYQYIMIMAKSSEHVFAIKNYISTIFPPTSP